MNIKLPQPHKAPAATYFTDGKMSSSEQTTGNKLFDQLKSTTHQVIVELFGQPQMGKTKTMIYTALKIVETDPNAHVFIVTSVDRVSQKRNMRNKIGSLSKYIGSNRIKFGVSRYNGADFETEILRKINECSSCNIYVFYDEGHYGIQSDGTFSNTLNNLIQKKNCRLLLVGATNTQAQLSDYKMTRVTMEVPESYWGMQQVSDKINTDYFLDRMEVTDLDILNHVQKIYDYDSIKGYCMFWRTSENNVSSLVELIEKNTKYDWVIATSPGAKSIDTKLYNQGLGKISFGGYQPNGIADIVDNVWIHLQNQSNFLIVIIVDAFIAGDDFGDNKFRIIGWVENNSQLNAHTQSIGRMFCHINWPLSWLSNDSDNCYEKPGLTNSNNLIKLRIRNQTLIVAHKSLIKAQVRLNNTPLSDITPELLDSLGIANVATGIKLLGSSDTEWVNLSTRYEFCSTDYNSIISTLVEDGVQLAYAEEMWLRIYKFLSEDKTGKGSGVTSLIKKESYQGNYSLKNKVNYHGTDMYIFDFNRSNSNIIIGGIIMDANNVEIYVKNGHKCEVVKNPIQISNSTIFAQ